MECGHFDKVLKIFDDHVSDCDKDMVTRLNDCSSLLWRLELKGIEVGDRWDQLVDLWIDHVNDHAFAFADVHLAMTLISAGGEKKMRRFLESQHAYIEGEKSTNSVIIEQIGRKLVMGIIAFRRGEFAKTIEEIEPIRDQIFRIGGSNAQRDVFNLTLNAAQAQLSEAGRLNVSSQ
jgi:hypothetical protein